MLCIKNHASMRLFFLLVNPLLPTSTNFNKLLQISTNSNKKISILFNFNHLQLTWTNLDQLLPTFINHFQNFLQRNPHSFTLLTILQHLTTCTNSYQSFQKKYQFLPASINFTYLPMKRTGAIRVAFQCQCFLGT